MSSMAYQLRHEFLCDEYIFVYKLSRVTFSSSSSSSSSSSRAKQQQLQELAIQ